MAAKHPIIVWRRNRSRLLTAAVTAVALGVAACGGKDSGTKQSARANRGAVATAQASTAPATPVRPAADSGTAAAAVLPPTPQKPVTYQEAEAAFRDRDYVEAARLFEAYADRKPENVWGHYMLGLSAWKSGDVDGAELALGRAVELAPDNVKARVNLGRVLLDEGRPEDALAHLEHAVDVDPVSESAWRVLGNVQADLGRAEEAIESYKHALALDGGDTWSMNNLGLLLIRQGRYQDALPALARATEIDPDSPVFQNNLGVALERSGHTAAAAEAFRAAVAADSTYEKAAASLARVEPLVGDAAADPTDLVAMARAFVEEIARWSDAVVATNREPGS